MDTKSVVGKTTSLLRLVEQRIQLKKELEEKQKKQNRDKEPQHILGDVPYLPKDCISNIILRLPLESLNATRFVCKLWYGIVYSPAFIDAHLQRSDIGLIFSTRVTNSLPATKINFSVESKVSELQSMTGHHWPLFDRPALFCIKFMEIKDGKSTIKDYHTTCRGKIRATCNGLIVLDNCMKRGGLVILNPVTRELKTIPLGTRCSPHHESYGLAFNHDSSGYKLVHLFQDELKYIGCEIMNIGSESWRVVDGPCFGLFGWLGYEPVSAIGALHWIPNVGHNDYMVSMLFDDEKFEKIKLPHTGGIHDRIFDMGGFLGFVSRPGNNQIDVWILRSLGGEAWERQYIIGLGCPTMVPLYCARDCSELVFKCGDHDLHAYDHRLQLMRKVEMNKEHFTFANCCFPHVNSLISWRI